MDGVRASGIPFGFITTLTMYNIDEVEWVVGYAEEHGAGLVQIHPLEPEGAAVRNLDGSVPDVRESAFALIEGARLQAAYDVTVQVDVAHRAELVNHPEEFLVDPPSPDARLSQWLTPLVVETDGTVAPLTYGFPRPYVLGSLLEHPLPELAERWDPGPFLDLTRRVGLRLADDDRPLFNWYDELAAEGRLVPA
jgi:MoaA/NifB/PqqE/SkfB family radical SAM enzyme